jgi:hypothetical protein
MYVQGTLIGRSTAAANDDRPISSAIVAPSAPGVMWGGMAIQAFLQGSELGFALQLAQTVTQISGFTVFDRSTALVSTEEDPVPTAGPNYAINFVNVGSGARLVLAASDAVLEALENAPVTMQLSWDFECQRVIPFSDAAGALPIPSIVAPIKNAWVVLRDEDAACWDTGAAVIVQL